MQKKKNNYIYIGLQASLVIGALFFLISYAVSWDVNRILASSLDNFWLCIYCLLFSILPYVLKKLKIGFTPTLQTYYLIAIIVHFIVGKTFYGYDTKYFSFIVHLINSSLIGVIIYGMLLRNCKKQGRLFLFIVTLACVALIGAVWELVEFSIDSWFDGNMQKTCDPVSGVPFVGQRAIWDTMYDILMDVLGGIIGGIVSCFVVIKGKPIFVYFALKSSVPRKPLLGEVSYPNENNDKKLVNQSELKNTKNRSQKENQKQNSTKV